MSCFSGSLGRKRDKRAKTSFQSQWQHFYHINWTLWRSLRWKNSLFVTWKILRQFFNTLTADDEYSLLNRGTLTQHIQMHLSQKERNSFEFFCAFFKSTLNFKSKNCLLTHWLPMTSILFLIEAFYYNVFRCSYLKNKKLFLNYLCIFQTYIKFWKFSTKDDPRSLCFSEITDSERCG